MTILAIIRHSGISAWDKLRLLLGLGVCEPGYHADIARNPLLTLASFLPSQPANQWLGPGYYFWEDEGYAEWWGREKKCKQTAAGQFLVYKANWFVLKRAFLDTVFNRTDYQEFYDCMDTFKATYRQHHGGVDPSLQDFWEYIADHGLWQHIQVIRFADSPTGPSGHALKALTYGKRIQVCVKEKKNIRIFVPHFSGNCV